MSYRRFFAMIATSVVVMFCLMYLNSNQILDHAWFSETRAFMALIMGGAMMIVMLAFMLKMYENRIEDSRVRELAREIIEAQRREIREMKWLIDDIRQNGPARTQTEADARPVPDFPATPE